MPDAPELVTLVSPDGAVASVPVNQAGTLLAGGYTVESPDQATARLATGARDELYGGIAGQITAGLAGVGRGITLGASDVLGSAIGLGDGLQDLRAANPITSTIGELGGAAATAFAAPGSLLARTPAGMVARAGARVAGIGEGAGLAARSAYAAGGAALEGAAQNAGAYISDVALGDRELSADGFMGAMGSGALWGGVAGGALTAASGGLQAARRLFPRQEMTREAVQAAENVARREVSSAVDDGEILAKAARDRLRQIRADRAALDLDTKVKLDDIAVRRAQELSDAQVAKAQAQTERAQIQLEKAKAGPSRRTRKAMQESTEEAAAVVAPADDVAMGATEDATTTLERQLLGTKAGLDAGQTLEQLGAQRPKVTGLKATHVEDGLNAEIAKVDPEAARLVKGLDELEQGRDAMSTWLGKYGKGSAVAKHERAQASRDAVSGWRKTEGYVDVLPMDSQRPGFTEGGMGAPRGRQSIWRGPEEARALADAKTISKLDPEERIRADEAIDEMFGRRERAAIAEDIAEGKPPVKPVDEQVGDAVRSKVDSIDDDIAESADVISRHEAASAEIADALGPMAPPAAQARAQAFREAQQGAETATQDAAVKATAEAEQAAETIALGGIPAKVRGGLLGTAHDVATATEALRMMGVDLPDPRNIPVIGPVLGHYLRARVAMKAFGRFGGKVAASAESTIASKAAQTRERVLAAADKMLDVVSKGAARAAPKIGGPAAALGHVLFDDKEPQAKAYTSAAPKGSIGEMYLARSDEISRAMQPGAIERAVRARVKTSDPSIVDAIVEAQTRKLGYLDQHMPKPNEPTLPTEARMPWIPSKAEINAWGRRVEAAENPVAVMEAAATGGHLSIEAVETIKTVYPRLFAMAQQRIMERAMDRTEPIPYARRVQLSIMFEMPFDQSQTPETAALLQQSYQPPAPPPQPTPLGQTPTVTADVRMADRTSPET